MMTVAYGNARSVRQNSGLAARIILIPNYHPSRDFCPYQAICTATPMP